VLRTAHGASAIVDLGGERKAILRNLAVNASVMRQRTAVPALTGALDTGDHRLAALVIASPSFDLLIEPSFDRSEIPEEALALLDRASALDTP
jgi:hypothetical protein